MFGNALWSFEQLIYAFLAFVYDFLGDLLYGATVQQYM